MSSDLAVETSVHEKVKELQRLADGFHALQVGNSEAPLEVIYLDGDARPWRIAEKGHRSDRGGAMLVYETFEEIATALKEQLGRLVGDLQFAEHMATAIDHLGADAPPLQ